MTKKLSTFDRLALLPVYARKRLKVRGRKTVLKEPKNSELMHIKLEPKVWQFVEKMAISTSDLAGFTVSPEQTLGLLVEILFETSSKKELAKILKPL